MDTTNQATTATIACDLTRIPAEQIPLHEERARYLFGPGTLERKETDDGFAFRFNPEDYETVTAFIAHERLCCPFYTFTLELQPNSGPIWLRLSGPDGIKPLLDAGITDLALGQASQ